jgi:LAO/AO transport system ATPase
MELSDRVLKGDKRAAARLITLIENDDQYAVDEIKKLYKYTGKAHIIGITGPPGAGKSTVTDKAANFLLNTGKKVGIVAVDPTSPFTGGAILGDRIRMQDLSTNPNAFIRSMGARGHLGGVAKATSSAVRVLDALGCDYIFIETVGVGQSEIDVVKMTDTTVIIMVPGLGDDIQAIKAGIMEIGDIFVVNKADRDGAERVEAEINAALDFYNYDRRPPVVKTAATTGSGIDALVQSICDHMEYLCSANKLQHRRKDNSRVEITEIVKQNIISMVSGNIGSVSIDELSMQVSLREMDPYTASDMILKEIGRQGGYYDR